MDAISIFDAESSLGSLLDALEAGQDVLVLRDGKPVARLVPPTREDTTALTVGGLRALRDRIAARGETFSPDEIEIFSWRRPPVSLCILDASMALAWVLPIESDASDILEQVAAKGAIVPGLWALEVGHVLLTAERKRRIVTAERTQALELLAALPISIDTETARHAWSATMTLAAKHGLSLYDASYLELAIRCSRPLASRDAKLLRAASACSVPVIV